MMYVNTLKRDYNELNLPYRFVSILPEECPTCGGLMAISETLTGLHCCNSRCQDKLVMRIKAICQDLGILGFGESTIEKFIDYYEITNPLNMFALRQGMPLGEGISIETSDKISKQIEEKRNFLLWEYVRIANIPGIQTSAQPIFQGYKTLEEAYADIEDGGVPFIMKKLGLTGDEDGISIRAMKIFESLMEYKDDLLESIVDVNIIDISGVTELNVVCSDQVGNGFSKKNEFYTYINSHFSDKVHVNFLPSVKKSIDYLVWAGADGSPARYTSKVQTVENWKERGVADIPIVTASQFIETIENM